jgi:hypothetical protein
MHSACISDVCKLLGGSIFNVSEKLDAFGAARENKLKNEWLSGTSFENSSVLDLWNVSVAAVGSVALCSGNMVLKTVRTHGCKKEGITPRSCSANRPSYDNVILISQYWGLNYYHALIEGLPRMAIALDHLGPSANASDWVLHSVAKDPLATNIADFFGFRRVVQGDIRANRVIFVMPSPCGGSVGGLRLNLFRSYIHTRIPLQIRLLGCRGHSGIMIVFKRQAARALANHAEVMHTARRLWTEGVVIEQSGNGTFREQMTLFASTVVLFGPHGAGMAGSVAMLPGRTMVEVLPEKGTNRLNMCFVTLAHDLGLHYYAVRAPGFDSRGMGVVSIPAMEALPIWPAPRAAHKGSGVNGSTPVPGQ